MLPGPRLSKSHTPTNTAAAQTLSMKTAYSTKRAAALRRLRVALAWAGRGGGSSAAFGSRPRGPSGEEGHTGEI